jgi:ceramide kinase
MITTLAYGFFGDIIQQSDNWRFVGPVRYNLSGFAQFIRNRSYHTQLIITQTEEKYSSKILVQNINQNLLANLENSSLPSEIKLEGDYRTINCLNMPCRCEKSKYGMSPSVHLGKLIMNKFSIP